MTETNKPVKTGDKIIIDITDEGKKGDGMCRTKNFVIIIPNTQKGKRYEVEITSMYATYAFGKAIKEIQKKEL